MGDHALAPLKSEREIYIAGETINPHMETLSDSDRRLWKVCLRLRGGSTGGTTTVAPSDYRVFYLSTAESVNVPWSDARLAFDRAINSDDMVDGMEQLRVVQFVYTDGEGDEVVVVNELQWRAYLELSRLLAFTKSPAAAEQRVTGAPVPVGGVQYSHRAVLIVTATTSPRGTTAVQQQDNTSSSIAATTATGETPLGVTADAVPTSTLTRGVVVHQNAQAGVDKERDLISWAPEASASVATAPTQHDTLTTEALLTVAAGTSTQPTMRSLSPTASDTETVQHRVGRQQDRASAPAAEDRRPSPTLTAHYNFLDQRPPSPDRNSRASTARPHANVQEAPKVVYTTRTGACYHGRSCRYAPDEFVSVAEAECRGLRPCSHCGGRPFAMQDRPQQLW